MTFFWNLLFFLNVLLIILVFFQNDLPKEIENFSEEITFSEYFFFGCFAVQIILLLAVIKIA